MTSLKDSPWLPAVSSSIFADERSGRCQGDQEGAGGQGHGCQEFKTAQAQLISDKWQGQEKPHEFQVNLSNVKLLLYTFSIGSGRRSVRPARNCPTSWTASLSCLGNFLPWRNKFLEYALCKMLYWFATMKVLSRQLNNSRPYSQMTRVLSVIQFNHHQKGNSRVEELCKGSTSAV